MGKKILTILRVKIEFIQTSAAHIFGIQTEAPGCPSTTLMDFIKLKILLHIFQTLIANKTKLFIQNILNHAVDKEKQ